MYNCEVKEEGCPYCFYKYHRNMICIQLNLMELIFFKKFKSWFGLEQKVMFFRLYYKMYFSQTIFVLVATYRLYSRREAVDNADTAIALMSRKLQIRIPLHNHCTIGRLVPNQLAIDQSAHGTCFLHLKGLFQAWMAKRMATFLQGCPLYYVPHANWASVTILCLTVGTYARVHVFPQRGLMEHGAHLLISRLPEPLLLSLGAPWLGRWSLKQAPFSILLQGIHARQQSPLPLGSSLLFTHFFAGTSA